jgi:iron complex transport system ATP-binding protein
MKISIQNIEFSYNGSPVLKDIGCNISKGDFVALVGPNGSGKSTLIKCITGILKPKKGAILISDLNINNLQVNELAQTLAYIPQNRNGQVPVSVFDTVLLGRKPYISWKPSKNDLEITSQVINQLNINDIAQKDINKLSGGQQQMVYIARALAQQPEILLLDEPTANLDIRHTIEIMDLLKGLCSKGLTVVIAIHDINLAMRYASHIMMLKEGEIFAFGGNEIITEQYIEKLYDVRVKIVTSDTTMHVIPVGAVDSQQKTSNQ